MANSSPAFALWLALASSCGTWAGSIPAAGSKGERGGFQQQYTHQYAKQFEQYMSGGDKGGNLPKFASGILGEHASGFQKYMDRSGSNAATGKSGDFEKYMARSAGQAGASTQGGSYQQYGDYHKYMHQGGAQQSQSGGYQNYYQNYTGQYAGGYVNFMGQAVAANVTAPSSAGASSTQAGSYQQYAGDYSKYMHQGGAQQSQSGGYQNYYQKYMGQAGGQQSQSGSYQKYMDGYAPNLTNASDSKEWAAYYTRENSGNYSAALARQLAGSNMTHDEALQRWGKTYMDKYAAPYQHYTHRQAAASSVPASASSCHNASELKAWRAAEFERIISFVPKAFRASAEDAVERTFRSNQARIGRDEAIQAQRAADEEARKAAQEGSAAHADSRPLKVAKQGSASPSDREGGKAERQGSAAPVGKEADSKSGKAAQEGSAASASHLREPASASASGDGSKQAASIKAAMASGSANKKTDQGSANQAMARQPPASASASAVQLAGEGSVMLVRNTHMDRSVASIAALAVLVALSVAYVGKARRRPRVMEPEGYTHLIAEP